MYVISRSKFVVVSSGAQRAILIFEQYAFITYNPLFADAEPHDCYWRHTVLHGHGDAERASSRRRCPSPAFQQQHGGGQGAFQRDRCGRSHQRDLYGKHVYGFLLN